MVWDFGSILCTSTVPSSLWRNKARTSSSRPSRFKVPREPRIDSILLFSSRLNPCGSFDVPQEHLSVRSNRHHKGSSRVLLFPLQFVGSRRTHSTLVLRSTSRTEVSWCIPLSLPSSCKPTLGTCTSSSRLELIFHLDSCHFANLLLLDRELLVQRETLQSLTSSTSNSLSHNSLLSPWNITSDELSKSFTSPTFNTASQVRHVAEPASQVPQVFQVVVPVDGLLFPRFPRQWTSFRSRTTSMSSFDPLRTS